ncbi:ferrous iron transport protein A [Anaerosalibacter massiliensis]|uniref:Ferrous iron transport protein A n=1 Tax=Anaerosalibacter massiliensis TaxID=1347392 RepID=A0A9X2MIT4_9FIRM|nr:FeoA family protein [Anaerosalibacter massiliensis]MCR2044306.1 ferrous iron transport protein A [Anaerosalibacter massiliensis]
MKSLNEMPLGSKTTVVSISKEASVRRRLMDMGVVPGVEVEIKGRAPLGDPIEILLRGYKLTLRKNEASNIFVK